MSQLIFPALAGLGWDINRTPVWATGVFEALSGKTSTVGYQAYKRVRWKLNFEVLREVGAPGWSAAISSGVSELLEVVGLFEAMQGRYDSFLYVDPDFNQAIAQPFGVVAAGVLNYQLLATYQNSAGPGYNELIQNVVASPAPTLYANGSPISNTTYTIGPTGVVTFSALPAVGAVLTWSGFFYYRCRFDDDELKGLTKSMLKIWKLDDLSFTSIKL
jgi:uncharacterized protein (TIGR02217 family)